MGSRSMANSNARWTRKGGSAAWNLKVRSKDGSSMEASTFSTTPKTPELAAWRDNFAFALWMLISFGGPFPLLEGAEPEVVEFKEAVKAYEAAAKKYEDWCDAKALGR